MKLSAAAAFTAALFCLVGPAGLPPFGATPVFADVDSEDDVIGRGVALRKEGDDQAARDLFAKAYERFHSARAAGQLGLAEQALGRWVEAETHVREALRSPGDSWVKKNHDALSHDMLIIKTHIARVEILGQPEGAEIAINGRAVGRLPLASPISASAGEVDIEARAPGYRPEVRKLTLAGGQYQQVVVRLPKEEPPVHPAATTATALTPATAAFPVTSSTAPSSGTTPASNSAPGADQPATSLRPIAKWTALGLAGAGLALGVTSTVIRSSKLDQFSSAHGGGCVEMGGRAVDRDGVPVPECQGPLDAYKSTRTWQVVGFLGAGVFAVTWLALMLTEPAPSPGSKTSVARAPSLVCGPTADLTGAACLLSM